MKRILTLLAVGVLALAASLTMAEEKTAGHGGAKMEMAGTTKTLTGEVVDMGCYLGHEARGEKHITCATKCINQGMPMGLLTSSGALYLLTMSHENADPYNKLKTMAGKSVSVTGTVMSRAGINGMDVTAFKPVAAATTK